MKIEEIEKISKARLEICKTCPNRQSYNSETFDWDKDVEDDKCGICQCPLLMKSMSNVESKEKISCPLGKW
jgi:hypothetical protein